MVLTIIMVDVYQGEVILILETGIKFNISFHGTFDGSAGGLGRFPAQTPQSAPLSWSPRNSQIVIRRLPRQAPLCRCDPRRPLPGKAVASLPARLQLVSDEPVHLNYTQAREVIDRCP